MTEDEALAFADGLAGRCSGALGDAVASVILHGSLTLGEFVPHRSDIDLLVVVEQPLGDERLAGLRDAVREDAPPRADLRVVTRAVAASPPRPTPMEAAFEFRPGKELAMDTLVTDEPDLLVELSVTRAHGRSLAGQPPGTVIGPVPRRWLLEVGDRQLAAWQRLTDDAAHAELMVLTACRIWRFTVVDIHSSKTAAGRWALARDPSLSAVDEALRQRTVDPTVAIGEAGIGRLLAHVRQELRSQLNSM